jgi:hypothetical protein
VAGDLFHGRIPDGAVYVGRQAPGLSRSRFANRHRVGRCAVCGIEHDRTGAVAAYATDLDQNPALLRAARAELAGRELACWCPLGLACHADVLVAVVTRPRVWLAGAERGRLVPADAPVVRDDLMRHWQPAPGGYRTADGRHYATWAELHARFDLVEVGWPCASA